MTAETSKDCKYPDCEHCGFDDCVMEQNDIQTQTVECKSDSISAKAEGLQDKDKSKSAAL